MGLFRFQPSSMIGQRLCGSGEASHRTPPPCNPIRTSLASYSNTGPTFTPKGNWFYSLFSTAVIHDSLFLSLESSHGRSGFIDLKQAASLRGNVTDPKRYFVICIVVIHYFKLFDWQRGNKKKPTSASNTHTFESGPRNWPSNNPSVTANSLVRR